MWMYATYCLSPIISLRLSAAANNKILQAYFSRILIKIFEIFTHTHARQQLLLVLWERFQTFTYCRVLCIYVHVKGQRRPFYHLGWTQLNWNVTAVVPSNLKALECCKPVDSPAKQIKINSLTVQIYMITDNILCIMLAEFLSTSRAQAAFGVDWSWEACCAAQEQGSRLL